jgi:hypothetical protein
MPIMKILMMLAASRLFIPGEENSRASKDNVIVSREASRMIGAVVPAALVKFKTDKRARVGMSNGSQIRK